MPAKVFLCVSVRTPLLWIPTRNFSGLQTVLQLELLSTCLPPELLIAHPCIFLSLGTRRSTDEILRNHGSLGRADHSCRWNGGSWVLKLPSARFAAVPENEFTMMSLARASGMEVPPIELIDMSDIRGLPADAGTLEGKALGVKRFDRGPGGERTHMEDFRTGFWRLSRR
jgi:hypothetical protein